MTNPLLPPRSSGRSWRRRGAAAGLCSAVAIAGLAAPAAPTGAVASAAAAAAPRHLDLGPADLPESRTTRTLQRGRDADPDHPRDAATPACVGPRRS